MLLVRPNVSPSMLPAGVGPRCQVIQSPLLRYKQKQRLRRQQQCSASLLPLFSTAAGSRAPHKWQQQQPATSFASLDSNDQNPEQEPTSTPYPPEDSPLNPNPKTQGPSPLKPRKTPPGGGDNPPEPPGPPSLPPQLQRLLLLLTEFGGIYGTAAVVIAWFTHVDPFGGLHWDAAHVVTGISFFLPIIALDAVIMLPDYSIGPEDSQEVAGMFFGDPDALKNWGAAGMTVTPATGSGSEVTPGGTSGDTSGDAASSSSSSSSSSAGAAGQPDTSGASAASDASAPVNPLLRLQLSLEVLQQVYTRANPGAALSPAGELVVVMISCLADEMLYRAVGLTLLGLWLRDRLYEAGFDESVSLSWLPGEVPTPEAASWAAVGLIAALGVAGFAAGALREVESLKRLQVMDKDGGSSEAAAAVKARLVASLGSQNLLVLGVEGVREVGASVAAGAAFLLTGNLAAPLAGSLLVQTLFSTYQRLSMQRVRKKRQELLKKMKQRSDKLQAAMAAALAAKQAAAPAEAEVSDGSSSRSDDGTGDDAAAEASSKEENADFLTLVLEAAEKQQEQERQQRSRGAAAAGNGAGSSSSSSSTETSDAASGPSSTAANWAAPGPQDSRSSSSIGSSSSSSSSNGSSEGSSGSSSNGSSSSATEAEAARQQLSVLLEDMLRSPEGFLVVQKWIGSQNVTTSSNSGSSSGSSVDPRKAVDQLLADPETKAKLLQELEEQLCAMSETAQQRRKQEETWRR